jgi:hypothetical protein
MPAPATASIDVMIGEQAPDDTQASHLITLRDPSTRSVATFKKAAEGRGSLPSLPRF